MYFIANNTVHINTKTANASEKVSNTRKGNVSSGTAVTKVENGEYREMISNLMEPSHPFLLPRTVPTSAAVMFHKPQLSIIKNLETEPTSVMVIRPDVYNTVTFSTLSPIAAVVPDYVKWPLYDEAEIYPAATKFSFSAPLLLDSGEVLVPTLLDEPGTLYYEADGSQKNGKVAFYEGLNITAGGICNFALSTTVTVATNVKLRLLDIVNGQIAESASTAVVSHGVTTFSVTIAGGFGGSGVKFYIVAQNLVGQYFQNTSWEMQLIQFSSSAGLVAKTMSIWEMLGNVTGAEVSEQQYNSAERYSITGFSALLRNTTASQYKSGSIVAAQLPGGSEHLVPHDPEEAYRFIASYNDPKTHSGQLNKGLHWFFSPEKVQDWFFRPTQDTLGERPYLALAWTGVAANDLANMLGMTLDIRINIELLTTDISLMKFMPSPDLSRLFDLYITMVNAHNSVGENPDHKAKIRKIVNSILSSPYTKAALKAAMAAGKVVVPLALAAL